MTKLTLLAVALSICAITTLAAESDDSPFPTVGKSYVIRLGENARVLTGFTGSRPVKILRNGGDGWYYVEYTTIPAQYQAPATPSPSRQVKIWLNFRHVVSASEVKEPEAGH